jgi:hypothetical protein
MSVYGSLEVARELEAFPSGHHPRPPWVNDDAQATRIMQERFNYWSRRSNHETSSPPVYYALAGLWFKIVKWVGVSNVGRIYWIRFLNVPLYISFLWLTYVYCRRIARDERHVYLGVPLLLAVLPQDVFYQINSDVLGPIGFIVAMILLDRWHQHDSLRIALAIALVVAMTFLVKLSNLALPIVLGVVMLCHLRRRPRNVIMALIVVAVPVGLWVVRNQILFGDITGTATKVQTIGFVPRPLSQYLQHPIFTPAGCWTYLSGLFHTFWRGEFMWHGERLTYRWLDMLYAVSTLVLLISALVGSVRRGEKMMDMMLHALVWLSVIWIAFLSVYHDYPRASYPSMAHPYHTTGRLISGVIAPLLILYVRGAATIGGRMGAWIVVALMCAVMLVTEVVLTWPVFASEFNWFHLP